MFLLFWLLLFVFNQIPVGARLKLTLFIEMKCQVFFNLSYVQIFQKKKKKHVYSVIFTTNFRRIEFFFVCF